MPQNEDDALILGKEKISKLLWKFALPAIAAMLASSVYNVIAGIFIADIDAYAISGVGLTGPIMNLAAAFGALVGVGASVVCSISLGEKNYEKARQVLANLVILNFIIGIIVSAIGLIFLDPILVFFGASDKTLPFAHDYMMIILAGNIFAHMFLGLNSVLRVSGYPTTSMNLTFLSVIINLILAPTFIYGMDMGVRGAALATVIAQIICCIAIFYIFSDKNKTVYFEKNKFKLSPAIIRQSFAIGSPNFFTNAAACFVVMIQNSKLLEYGGDLYIGGMSIVNRIVFIFFMIALGFSQGMQPIVAYNFGAQKYHRMWEAFSLTLKCALCVTVSATLICELYPELLTSLFVSAGDPASRQLFDITVKTFRYVMPAFWIIAFQVIGSNFFASMNQPHKSLFLSLTRQVILMVPLLYILPRFWGTHGVWIISPITDFSAALVAILLLYLQKEKDKVLLTSPHDELTI